MKIKQMELGESKDKPESVMLWDKTHLKYIILNYSFDELNGLLEADKKEKHK